MDHDALSRESSPLPTQRDFDNGILDDLDAQCAWRNFGGLTLEQAHSKFQEAPHYYQESFMFMGGKAFAFYFPIVESYFHESSASDDGDDRDAWEILAHCIKMQFDCSPSHVMHLAARVLELSKFVLKNMELFDPKDRREIEPAWQKLQDGIQKTVN